MSQPLLPTLQLLTPKELGLMVCGSEELSADRLHRMVLWPRDAKALADLGFT